MPSVRTLSSSLRAPRSVRSALVVGLLVAVPGCATNPVTRKREFSLVSERQEVEMGSQAADEVRQSIGLYPSPAVQKYVSDIGQRLAAQSERPALPWSFDVVDDATVNAFALPGGKIFVTRGLMTHLNSEAQLAAVLGHEIGHVTAKHSVRMISKAQLAQIGLGLGSIFSESLGQLGGAGLSMLFLKYGRDAEHQADELGFRYALATSYDVREMPQVFATLKRVGEAHGASGKLPSWLATHPEPDERIERTKERLTKTSADLSRSIVRHDEYLRVLDGMVYGENPRQGFFKESTFSHPEMKFTIVMPQGWKTQNLSQAVMAAAPTEDGAIQLTITPATSPEEGLRQFFSKTVVQAVGEPMRPITSMPSASSRFTAKIEQTQLSGLVTFVSHEGKVFQILGIAPAEKAASHEQTFLKTHATFARLTDPTALAMQPARIRVARVAQPMTLADFYRTKPSTVPLPEVALVNQSEPTTPLQAGQLLKSVEGGVGVKATATAGR